MSSPSPRLPLLLKLALAAIGLIVVFVLAQQDIYFNVARSDVPRLVILVAVLLFVAAGLFGRALRPGEIIRGLAAWAAVILVLVALYANRDQLAGVAGRILGAIAPGVPVSGTLAGVGDADSVVVTRAADGHFGVLGMANQKQLLFLVDTGASFVTLSRDDARDAGLDPDALKYDLPIRTANGTMVAAGVELDRVTVGPIVRRHVRALVAPAGALDQSLLGMTFLDTLTSYSVSGDRLILKP